MSMSGWLILVAVTMWVSQTVLGLWQFKRFHRRVRELRKNGRVAIGKAKGRFLAGAVVLLTIDEDSRILHGEVMKGRTVFAGFSPMEALNGLRLPEITEKDCEGLSTQLRIAVMDARKELQEFTELHEEEQSEEALRSPSISKEAAT